MLITWTAFLANGNHLFYLISMFCLFSICSLFVIFFLWILTAFKIQLKYLNYFYLNFKFLSLALVTFSSIWLTLIYLFFGMHNWVQLQLNAGTQISVLLTSTTIYFDFLFFLFHIETNIFLILNTYNLSFMLLFSFLYPVIFWILSYDYNLVRLKLYIYMLFVFFLSFFLLLIDNLVLFYFIYEMLLILIFRVIFLSSNASGGIEGSLFYAGWALIGSILVGLGFLFILQLTNCWTFSMLIDYSLTTSEIYYLYLLFFFGFGTKLSIWPFWYWLPRAHVEVSTGISIFLSCILMKLAYFALMKIQLSLSAEISLNLCIIVALFCVIDVVIRFINLRDLKAIIAYSSVLHTNLLIILIHLDTSKIANYTMLYVWGHSLATACLFLCVNLIESQYGSRNIIFVSGLWFVNPVVAYLTFWSLLFFLELPCTLFFWGEIWLWIMFLNKFLILGMIMLFFCNVIFISIFFKMWWGILYGTVEHNTYQINMVYFKKLKLLILFLIVTQFLVGFQPAFITSSMWIL